MSMELLTTGRALWRRKPERKGCRHQEQQKQDQALHSLQKRPCNAPEAHQETMWIVPRAHKENIRFSGGITAGAHMAFAISWFPFRLLR
jgi:hypothetical protein